MFEFMRFYWKKLHLDKINVVQNKINQFIAWIWKKKYSAYVCLPYASKVMNFHNDNGWLHTYENVDHNRRSSSMKNLIVPFIRATHTRQPIDYTAPINRNLLPHSLKYEEDYYIYLHGFWNVNCSRSWFVYHFM